jgi:hypothetical protein
MQGSSWSLSPDPITADSVTVRLNENLWNLYALNSEVARRILQMPCLCDANRFISNRNGMAGKKSPFLASTLLVRGNDVTYARCNGKSGWYLWIAGF